MIDNTSSAVDAGSLGLQREAQAKTSVKAANISDLAKTDIVAPEKVVTQVNKIKDTSDSVNVAPEELEQVVETLNAFVQLTKRDVSFGIDDNSGRDVISVFEAETQELIRQIPSEEALALLKRMDKAIGLLFSEKV